MIRTCTLEILIMTHFLPKHVPTLGLLAVTTLTPGIALCALTVLDTPATPLPSHRLNRRNMGAHRHWGTPGCHWENAVRILTRDTDR